MFGLVITYPNGHTDPTVWCRTELQRDGIAAEEVADGNKVSFL